MTGVELLVAASVASTVVSAVGARRQGQAIEAASNYNAQVAEGDAQSAREYAKFEATQIDRENRIRLGKLRANAAASGIEMQGNVLDLVGDLTTQGIIAKQDALWRGEMRARGFEQQATLDRFEGRDARRAARLTVAGTLLRGASQAGETWMRFNG